MIDPTTLTRLAFATWLESKPQSAVVGNACDGCACPLHAFIMAHLPGYALATVMPDRLYISTQEERVYQTPAWMRDFINTLDAGGKRRITAAEALTTLRQLHRLEAQS